MTSGSNSGRVRVSAVRTIGGIVCCGLLWSMAAAAGSGDGEDSLEQASARSEALRDELIAVRREIHRHPEVSGQEEHTARLVADRLRALGLDVRAGVGGHGVVAVLRGGKGGAVVAYRADMDAVQTQRVANTDFESEVPGVHHVCGHDAHVAVGLGVAEVLAGLREQLPGTVVFLFQPSEENLEGAEDMLRDGAFKDPKPEAIFAVHTSPLPVGQIGCAPGHGLPGLQIYDVTVRGLDDPKASAQRLVEAIGAQSTVAPPRSAEEFARFMEALRTEGGGFLANFLYTGARVVSIDDEGEVLIRGFVRDAGSPGVRGALYATRQLLVGLPDEGATFEMRMDEPFPAMVNDPELTRDACETVAKVLGQEAAVTVYASHPFNGEDFAYYQELIPGAMFWLGVANSAKGISGVPHAPDFDIDEEALVVGTQAMAGVLIGYLEANH